ncbi:MAG TPA: hypothetical protein PK890_10995, partial [Terrimesophilobacter sp.]|nr:hypothetical protein [Terrimesophilobacter sp.]
ARDFLARRDEPAVQTNRRFFTGDHWQNGDGWVGPRPRTSTGDASNAREVLRLIEQNFVSKNIVKEVVERHSSSVVGREPNWRFTRRDGETDTEQQRDAVKSMERALTEWWDEQRIGELLTEAVDTSLYADTSSIRLFIPNATEIPRLPFTEALALIHAEALDVDTAGVFTDPDTSERIAVYVTRDDKQTVTEFSYLDENDLTVTERIDGTADPDAESTPLDLGGRLPIIQLERKRIVSPQVCQNQRLLNMAVTMLSRNVVLGGFLERTIINAEMPGSYETDADGIKRFVPTPVTVGAGAVNILQSATVEDSMGRLTALPTSVIYRDPVNVATFTETKREAQENVYDEVKQRHILIAGDATASGVSRQQAKADFESDLNRTKLSVDRAIRQLLETVIALAAALSGENTDFLDQYRAVGDARITVAPPSDSEQVTAVALRDAELISTETAMGRVGVEDPESELQRIRQERADEIEHAANTTPATGDVTPTSRLLALLGRLDR